MKRKSDEARAEAWAKAQFYCRQDGKGKADPDLVAHHADVYLRGMKRAKADLKREQAETLRRLLDVAEREVRTRRAIWDVAGAHPYESRAEGIRACIKALGFSEKGGVK